MAPMPTARIFAGMAVLDGKLYVAGGREGGAASNLVERYDFETKAWDEVAPMATARYENALWWRSTAGCTLREASTPAASLRWSGTTPLRTRKRRRRR